MAVTAADLAEEVNRKLESWIEEGADTHTVTAEENTTKRFRLSHGNIINGTLNIYVDGVLQTKVTTRGAAGVYVDYDSGWLYFSTAPGTDAVITADYQWRYYSDDRVLQALNSALAYAYPRLPLRGIDSTSLSGDGTSTQFTLPADVGYLERIDTSLDGSSWTREYDWRIDEAYDEDTDTTDRYLMFIGGAPSTVTIRLRYVRARGTLATTASELQKDGHVRAEASDGMVNYACWDLLYSVIASRLRDNAFLNDEAPNVPKIYEALRVADSFRLAADAALDAARSTPRPR